MNLLLDCNYNQQPETIFSIHYVNIIWVLTFAFVVQEKEIVKIQAFLKANKARDDYKTLSE